MAELSLNTARTETLGPEALNNLDKLMTKMLPEQGAIEIQKDAPHKCHDWHHHDTDETLIILQGSMTFTIPDGDFLCEAGAVILLPKFTRHKSYAHEDGAVYIIAQRLLCPH